MTSHFRAYSECGPNQSHINDGPFGLNKTAEMQSSYALYLSKFVTAYGECGINVTSVMVQNEPYAGGCNYPKCEWTGAEMRDFIKEHFGPLFAKEHGENVMECLFAYKRKHFLSVFIFAHDGLILLSNCMYDYSV